MTIWKDRRDAGRHLAEKLAMYRGADAVVIALPRGGVVVGHEVACNLALPLDAIVTRKIGHPLSPEYAIGVVDERGMNLLNEREAASVGREWLEKEIIKERKEARRRSDSYRAGKGTLYLRGKISILVDDGIATGYTMRLAVKAAKRGRPKRIIVAVPVAPPEAVSVLMEEADEVIVLDDPEKFKGAVGLHYAAFGQVDDDEVIGLLHSSSLLAR